MSMVCKILKSIPKKTHHLFTPPCIRSVHSKTKQTKMKKRKKKKIVTDVAGKKRGATWVALTCSLKKQFLKLFKFSNEQNFFISGPENDLETI